MESVEMCKFNAITVAYIFIRPAILKWFPYGHDKQELKIMLRMMISESRQLIKFSPQGHGDLEASEMHNSL